MKVEVWTAIFIKDSHVTLCGHFGTIDEAEACGHETQNDIVLSGAKFVGVRRSFIDANELCDHGCSLVD